MRSFLNKLVIFPVIVTLVFVPLFCSSSLAQEMVEHEEDKDVGVLVYDLLLVRPVGVLSLIVGSTLWVVSVPFTAPFKGKTRESLQKMVIEPAKYTYYRPLGEF